MTNGTSWWNISYIDTALTTNLVEELALIFCSSEGQLNDANNENVILNIMVTL